MLLRQDGLYRIYRIQHNRKTPTRMAPAGEGWAFSSLDHFGTPPGFEASNQCWQTTGVYGTYDPETAKAALEWISKRNPKIEFRLVLVVVAQTTIEI